MIESFRAFNVTLSNAQLDRLKSMVDSVQPHTRSVRVTLGYFCCNAFIDSGSDLNIAELDTIKTFSPNSTLVPIKQLSIKPASSNKLNIQ